MFKPYQQVINFALQEYNSRVEIVKGKAIYEAFIYGFIQLYILGNFRWNHISTKVFYKKTHLVGIDIAFTLFMLLYNY